MKQKLLYLYPNKATFVQKDIAFLSKKYDVQTQDLPWADKISLPINFIKQFFFLISRTNKADAIIVMFGGYWSFLPALIGKLFSKRVFIILGGTDCVSFPEFNYGSLRKQPLKWFIKKSYQWSTRLLPVDDSLMSTDYNFLNNATYKKQGIKAHFPNLKTPYTVIPNGFDTTFWESNNDKIPLTFLSVAFVNDATRLTLKGFDTVIKLANHFKGATFTLVGLSKELTSQLQLPKNIKVYDYLSVDDLKKEIETHQFYLQLSLSEGFPNALAEAMLGKCIPIVNAVGGMSKIVGNTGFVLAQENETILIEAINKLLALPQSKLDELGCEAKNRIASNFSIENRATLFESILSEV